LNLLGIPLIALILIAIALNAMAHTFRSRTSELAIIALVFGLIGDYFMIASKECAPPLSFEKIMLRYLFY